MNAEGGGMLQTGGQEGSWETTDHDGRDPMLRACAAEGVVLRRPDHGTAVRWVQQALIDLGYLLPAFGADGVFGPETGAAVVAFKLDHGLDPPDPVVGASAVALLQELLLTE